MRGTPLTTMIGVCRPARRRYSAAKWSPRMPGPRSRSRTTASALKASSLATSSACSALRATHTANSSRSAVATAASVSGSSSTTRTFFATSLQSGASAILANGPLVKKVRMPLQLLPAASVLSALANFLLSVAVLFAVLAIFGPRHPEGLVWISLLIVVQIVMNLGFAYLLSALAVFFRDVQHILGILLLAWYFLTPVLFSVSVLDDRPEQLRLLYLNPMTAVIVSYQRA